MKLPTEPTIPNAKDMVFWLKFQKQLVDKLKASDTNPEEKSRLLLVWLWLVNLMCVDGDRIHGTAYVSNELAKATLVVAIAATIANWWNAATTLPFIYFIFKDFGLFTWPLTGAINVALIKFGNSVAEGAAAKQPLTLGFARIGITGFILLNLVQTLMSGVGAELLLNKSGLSRELGKQLVNDSIFIPLEKNISDLSQKDQTTISARHQCDRLTQKLEALEPNDLKREELHLAAYGTYQERLDGRFKTKSEDAIAQWPACPKANLLEQQHKENLTQAKEQKQKIFTEVKNHGSELAYLKKVKPEIYQTRFTESGEIESGTEAIRVAIVLFNDKFFTGQWADLGSSLFFFAMSAITSGTAILKIISYSDREDVQMSKSSAVIHARESFKHQIIANLNPSEVNAQQEKLLQLFFDELERTGRCDYPPFVDYVKYARKMEQSRPLREDLDSIQTAVEQIKNGCQELKNSRSDSEIANARNLIHQGCDSIKNLTGRYGKTHSKSYLSYSLKSNDEYWRVYDLIKTVEYVQDYLQHFPIALPLSPRQLGYLDEVLTSSLHLSDRLIQTLKQKYNSIVIDS